MQLLDLARALESGVDSNVAHALNALSLASFSAPEALLPAQRQLLPALIGIARSGLPEAFWEAESADLVEEPEEPDFSRPPVAVHRSKWAPKVQILFSGILLIQISALAFYGIVTNCIHTVWSARNLHPTRGFCPSTCCLPRPPVTCD